MQLKKQSGFTLVEIAIVLVIVGLLIGGVLKGQEMITNAKLKRVESDNAGIAAAMFSYQDRYLQLPGDDGAADTRFTVYTATTANGLGDGTIGIGNAAQFSWQAAGTLGYRVSRRVAVFAGYRVLEYDTVVGEGENRNGTDLRQQGPIIGAGFRL